MEIPPRLVAVLRQHGLRMTRQRMDVLSALMSLSHAPTAAELCKALSQMPRSSVYRNLEALEGIGIVESHVIKWHRRYEIASPYVHHHHHAVCTKCGGVTIIEHHGLQGLLHEIANKYQLDVTGHHFEIECVCHSCMTQRNDRALYGTSDNSIDNMQVPIL